MNDTIYLLSFLDDDGELVGELDFFYVDRESAEKEAIKRNLGIIRAYYDDSLLLFEPGFDEDSDGYDDHLLNYQNEKDALFIATAQAKSYIDESDSHYPYLYTVVPIKQIPLE